VEAGDRDLVLWRKCQQELLRRLAGACGALVPTAPPSRGEQQPPGRQALAPVEVHDLVRTALVPDAEVLAAQVRDRAALIVDGRRREHDELAPDGEGQHLALGRSREGTKRQ